LVGTPRLRRPRTTFSGARETRTRPLAWFYSARCYAGGDGAGVAFLSISWTSAAWGCQLFADICCQ